MVSLAGHLQSIESEKQKLRSQVRRLCQENAWLRDELADTQQRLQQSEQKCVTLDEERTHLQFMNEMRKYDSESSHQVTHCSLLLLSLLCGITVLHRVSKKRPTSTTCYNFYIHSSIATIFGTNVAEKVGNQNVFCFPTTPN